MSLLSSLGLLGGVFSLIGYYPYARSIIRGEAEPERATWLINALSNILILLSYFELGARTTIWVPVAYTIGTLFIAFLSFIYGRTGWGLIEQSTLVVAIISAIRWVFFNNVFLTLILIFSIGMIAYAKRFKKLVWGNEKERGQEDIIEWSMFFLGGLLNLLAVNVWTWEIALFPALIFALNGTIFFLVVKNSFENRSQRTKEDTELM
ncbi:MAG TPA: hypothetical protein VIR98_01885 [Candidatus Paceibacterota bacterium]|jgi:hypothetical protein